MLGARPIQTGAAAELVGHVGRHAPLASITCFQNSAPLGTQGLKERDPFLPSFLPTYYTHAALPAILPLSFFLFFISTTATVEMHTLPYSQVSGTLIETRGNP